MKVGGVGMGDIEPLGGPRRGQMPSYEPVAAGVPVAGVKGDDNTKSTLTPAEHQQKADEQKEVSGVPYLPLPIVNNTEIEKIIEEMIEKMSDIDSNKSLEMAVNMKMMEAVSSVLDDWIKNLHEMGDKKELASALRQIQDQLKESIRTGQKASDENVKKASKGKTAEAVAMLSGLLMTGIMPGVSQLTPGMQAMQELANSLATVLPTKIDGVFSSLITFFGAGVVAQSTMTNLKNVDMPDKVFKHEFAKDFAKKMMAAVCSDVIDKRVGKIFQKGGEELVFQKTQLAKITLLAQSLGFAYLQESGGITGKEFEAALKGEIKFDDFKHPLVMLLNHHLEQLPKEMQSDVLHRLSEYFDKRPSLNELSKPGNIIKKMYTLGEEGELKMPFRG